MADTKVIEGLNAFDLLDTEADRVAKYFEDADESTWAADTRCDGWTVRDMLSHCAGVETYHLACLNDAIMELFEEAGKQGATDVHSFNALQITMRADRSRDEVMDEWRTKNAEVRRRFRELGVTGTMSSSVGPYPAEHMAFHVASEYATHYDDMAGRLDDPERTAWRAKVSLFALSEKGDAAPEVTKEGDSYRVSKNGKEAMLSEADFVEAVTARNKDASLDDSLRDALVALA